MKKTNQQLIDRAKYVQEKVRNSDKVEPAVKDLAELLYLSERTIYNDLARDIPSSIKDD